LYGVKIRGPRETTQRLFVRARDRHPWWSISELNLYYKLLGIDKTKGIDNRSLHEVHGLLVRYLFTLLYFIWV
jgi:hypothetical protein